jgi:threonine dehydrogenase-like Zn-dependent dehydrogenase
VTSTRTTFAVVIAAPHQIELRELVDPGASPGHAVLDVSLSGICGTDKHTFRGESLQYAGTPHEHAIDYPLICGHENIGVLAELGDGARFLDQFGEVLEVGARVVPAANVACGSCWWCLRGEPYFMCERLEDYGNSLTLARVPGLWGGWAERMHLLPGTTLFRVPDAVPDEVAVLTEPMAVTHGLDEVLAGGNVGGETVVVLGCGPLGICHVLKAVLLGAGRVFVTDLHQPRVALAESIGAETLDLGVLSDSTDGRGADVVVDCTGVAETFAEALSLARVGGTVVEPGAFVDVGASPVNPNVIVTKSLRVIGVGGEILPAYAQALELMASSLDTLPWRQIVSHVLPLERAQEAVELSQQPEATKVCLRTE